MHFLDLAPLNHARGTVKLPGSKSISNRSLLLAALANGTTEVRDLLESDDTAVMLTALKMLGVDVQLLRDATYAVRGAGGVFPVKQAQLFMGNAGTAIRPLTAALAVSGGSYHLSGVPRMHERPIGDLVDGLRGIGASLDYLANPGFPPLAIHPAQIDARAPIKVRGDVSSQFLTALLMAAPLLSAAHPVQIEVVGELISKPYILITLALMKKFGVAVEQDEWRLFTIPRASAYQSPGVLHVEGDASSASYFLAAGLLGRGPVRVEGVGAGSIQGDVKFVAALEAMGAHVTLGDNFIEACGTVTKLRAIDGNFNHIPDAAMTLAVLALFAVGPSTLRNIASWRVKETDRIAAMATELRKVGATVQEGADFLRITPPTQFQAATIDTYDDHRMAMCFSLAAFGGAPIRINDPACVNKTFPTYFEVLESLTR